MKKFYSHGKLLITGEYVVLDGAKALAVPTKFGQELEVKKIEAPIIKWKSIDKNGNTWFTAEFLLKENYITVRDNSTADLQTASRLLEILKSAQQLNPGGISQDHGFEITTKLEFNRKWGLGSSSTLINNLASWLGIDAYRLLERSFGGSGYDIAAAQRNSAFTYQLNSGKPSVLNAQFNPPFKEELFFVYLNQKQNSRQAIAHYRSQPQENIARLSEKISGITEQVLPCDNLQEFCLLIDLHETLISKAVKLPRIKTQLFPDYKGSIKSLGSWGGDFILATGGAEEKEFFRSKNYTTILPFEEMLLI